MKLLRLIRRKSLGKMRVGDIAIPYPHRYILNGVAVVHNCPASCMFCKESLIARGFTEVAVSESTGVLQLSIDLDGEHLEFSTPSKAKVKFWDSAAKVMVYGPISVAITKGYPVSIDSIRKLVGKQLTRYLSD